MSSFVRPLLVIGGALGVFFLHYLAFNTLMYPIRLVNISVIAIILFSAFSRSSQGMYFALLLAFFHELFSGAVYGSQIIGLLVAMLIVNFILQRIFTNHSVYIIFLTSCVTLLTYRLLTIIFAFSNSLVDSSNWNFTITLAITVGWEVLLSSLVAAVLYLAGIHSFRRLNPKYIPTQYGRSI